MDIGLEVPSLCQEISSTNVRRLVESLHHTTFTEIPKFYMLKTGRAIVLVYIPLNLYNAVVIQ